MRALPLLAALALPLPALAQDQAPPDQAEEDRGFLTGLIEDQLSATARQVRIEGFQGALSSRATIARLTIADGEGVWLDARDLVLDWNRRALFSGRIEVQELSAGTIALLRPPVPDPDLPAPEATPFALPDLPVALQVDRLDAGRIELGAAFLGEPLALTLEGAVDLEGGEGTATLSADIVEGTTGSLDFRGAYSNATRVLGLDLDLQEAPDGLLANYLGLPGRPSVSLQLQGTGPVDAYEATLALATDGEPRVSGSLRATTTAPATAGEAAARRLALDLRGDVTALVAPDLRDFFGPDVQVSAEAAQGSDGSLSLDALDVSARALRLSGEAVIRPDGWPQRLRLDGTLGDPAGGAVALPGSGGTEVRSGRLLLDYDAAQGSGFTATIQAEGVAQGATTIERLLLDGNGTIEPAEGARPGAFAGTFRYEAAGLGFADQALRDALGASIAGDLALRRPAEGGPLRIESLTLSGPGVEASAEGSVSTDDGLSVQSTLDLTAEDLSRFARLSGLDGLSGAADLAVASTVRPLDGIFDLTLSGATTDLRLGVAELDPLLAGAGALSLRAARDEAGTRLDALRITTPLVDLDADASLTSGASRARLDLAVADLSRSFPTLSGPGRLSAALERDSIGLLRAEADATLPGATLSVTASQPAAGEDEAGEPVAQPVTLALDAAFDDLADYAAALREVLPDLALDPRGRAELSLAGTALPDASRFDLAARAATRDLGLGIARLDPLLAGPGSLSGRLARTGPADLTVEGLRLSTALLTASADASLLDGLPSGTFDLFVIDVAPLLDRLSGPARLSGTAARRADGGTDLDVAADLPTGQAALRGVLAPPEEGYAFAGEASAALSDLAPFGPLLGRDLGGAVDLGATGTVRPDLAALDATLSGTTRDLRLGLPALDPLLRGAGRLDATARRDEAGLALSLDAATPQGSAVVDATLPRAGGGEARFDLALPDVAVLAPGLSGPARARGTATRAPDGSIAVAADATAPGATARVDATVAPPLQGLAVSGRADLSVADLSPWSRLAGRPLSGGLDASLQGTLAPDLARFDLAVDARARDLSLGDPTLARLLAGTGTVQGRLLRDARGLGAQGLRARFPNLSVDADVTEGGQAIAFDARLADLALLVPDFPGPVTARGTARLGPRGTQLSADLAGPGGIQARVAGTLGATADLAATGTAPLGLLNAFVEPRRVEGAASFDLALRGPLSPSSLSGTVRVQGARLTDPALGTALAGVSGTVALAGGQARLDLSGAASDGGTLAATGTAGLAAPFPASLQVTASGLVLRDPTLYEATADARLTISGPLAGGATVAGAVDVLNAEIRVPSSGIGALGDLPEVRHVDPSPPVRLTLERAGLGAEGAAGAGAATGGGGGGGGYALDIAVDAPARVFVRGRGLDAELGGALRLSGTTGAVVPIGQVGLLRGRLDILGQRFTLTEGTATLQGDFVPVLRLVAETTSRAGVLVTVTLEGPANAPTVTFGSRPELPQDEVLAQLLFGQDLQSLSPFQAVQLASAVATLAGRGGGLLDSLRGDAGLADLDITTDAAGNPALRLGQYIGENVYTDVQIGAQETEATINLDLTPDLTVRAGVSSEGETTLGIEFARDY